MTLWLLFAALLVGALGFLVLPLYRHARRLSPLLAAVIIFVVASSAGLYHRIGQPGVPSGAAEPDVNAMVASLASRLEREPDDVEGWLMLARSYEVLQRLDDAAVAYEKVLELQPNHPTALFYGGYIAASRGEMNLAADRWEMILRFGAPPADVQEAMQRQIDAWRGETTRATTVSPAQPATIVTANIRLSNEAAAVLPRDATLFIIARDPEQPSPPIAVARRTLAEMPLIVSLGDRDAMVPGRTLSAYPRFELIARVSSSGQPIAQAGDWFGGVVHSTSDGATVEILIDRQVP